MIKKDKKIICIIIARGGSKGIKNKNLKKINGKPMIFWTIKHAKNCKFIKHIWVSSDSNAILNYSKKKGTNILVRPKKYANDFSSSDEAMNMKSDYNFVKWLKNIENSPLNKYHLKNPIDYNFVHTERQKAEKKEVFKRYGTDINALSKIVVRIKPENWLRTIKTKEIILDKKIDPKKSLARYSLSN